MEGHRSRNAVMYKFAASGVPATFVDLSEGLLDKSGKAYLADEDGVSLYYDDDHLTPAAVAKYVFPRVRAELAGKLGGPAVPR